jgi:hypothetical protein
MSAAALVEIIMSGGFAGFGVSSSVDAAGGGFRAAVLADDGTDAGVG